MGGYLYSDSPSVDPQAVRFSNGFYTKVSHGTKLDISRKGILIKLRCVKSYAYVLIVVVGSGVGSGANSGARSAFSVQTLNWNPWRRPRPLSEPRVMNRKTSTPQTIKSVWIVSRF